MVIFAIWVWVLVLHESAVSEVSLQHSNSNLQASTYFMSESVWGLTCCSTWHVTCAVDAGSVMGCKLVRQKDAFVLQRSAQQACNVLLSSTKHTHTHTGSGCECVSREESRMSHCSRYTTRQLKETCSRGHGSVSFILGCFSSDSNE